MKRLETTLPLMQPLDVRLGGTAVVRTVIQRVALGPNCCELNEERPADRVPQFHLTSIPVKRRST